MAPCGHSRRPDRRISGDEPRSPTVRLTEESHRCSYQHVLIGQSSLMDEAVVRALADPLRLRLVELLAAEQLCTCHLVADTGATQTNVSNHLRVLRDAGLIVSEPAGRYTYHRLVPDPLEGASAALANLASSVRSSGEVKRPCG
jgi:ArsR family transcriptional regulator, arsenate/arsenite/antimonite-responsive transcriptional repressor